MTLGELITAAKELIVRGSDPDEPVCVDVYGTAYELTGITVVVASDLWVPETVVMTVDLMEDGEADDG